MGAARLLENLGDGLYRCEVLFDTGSLEAEESRRAEEKTATEARIDARQKYRDTLQTAMEDARIALDAVIAQYREELITMAQPHVPADPPGATGATPDEIAANLESELFDLINAARDTPLTRASALDVAADQWAGYCLANNTTRDPMRDLTNYVVTRGYSYDDAVGIERAQAFGALSAAQALAMMQRAGDELTQANYTECGVAFRSIPASAYGYAWVVILTAPGAAVDITYPPPEDAASARAAIPEQFDAPAALAHAASIFAQAATAYNRVAADVEHLQLAADAIQDDIDAINAALSRKSRVVTLWCSVNNDFILGQVCETAEIRGYFDPTATTLLPYFATDQGTIAESLSAAGTVYNYAMEPGWLHWQPRYRYGIVVDHNPIRVSMSPVIARGHADTIQIHGGDIITPTVIHQCPWEDNPGNYQVGDEVVLWFPEQTITGSCVILGWRSHPRKCESQSGRQSWRQLR